MRKKQTTKNRTPLDRGTLKKIIQALAGYRLLLALSLLLALISVAAALYVPILIGRAIDLIAGKGQVRFDAILPILTQACAIAGGTALLQWLMGVINNRMTFGVVRDLRARAFETIERLPLRYLDSHAYGEIVSRVIADADAFADGLLLGFSQLFTGLMTILGTLVFMLAIDWKTWLVVILLTPISLISARVIATRTYRMFRALSDTRAEQTGYLDEMIKNQKVVQAFSHTDQTQATFDEINDRYAKNYLNATFYSSITNPATRFVNALVYAGVALIGALTSVATGGVFSVGQLSVFLSYAAQYTKPFNEISGVVTELQNALACANRIFALIEEPKEQPDASDAVQR
ncbi:MAG: ABC transporter ATP-binding protein [Clostridia bacterium]|nr:ABC transporter ATP-binding protein [Clostridia bacterium]